jgi:DNA-binding LytR/AlgR family response regulator
MKILIFEDEPLAAERLSNLIFQAVPSANLLAICDSVETAIQQLSIQTPDLIFSDIQLADGVSFEIFEQIHTKCPVIFTTAYDQYALEAFKVNSIDYILKPIAPEQVKNAILKYQNMQLQNKAEIAQHLEQLIQQGVFKEKNYRTRFLVKKGDRLIPLLCDEILFIFSEDKVSFAMHTSGQKYILEYTLDNLEEQLPPDMFFRANRKYLINSISLTEVRIHLNGKLKINLNFQPEKDIYVSRERSSKFRQWLGD